MADPAPEARLERVRQAPQPRLAVLVILAAATFVAVAVLKPWGTAPPPPEVAEPLSTITARPAPPTAAPSPTIDAQLQATLYRRQCQSGDGWRVISMERNGRVRSRTLWPVDPASAPTVADALRDEHRLWTEVVEGIGFCTPGQTVAERLSHVPEVTLWRLNEGGGVQQLETGQVIDPGLAAVGEVYWAPPARRQGARWPAGSYVFRVISPHGESPPGWFALVIAHVNP
jgi:hypothetical protein